MRTRTRRSARSSRTTQFHGQLPAAFERLARMILSFSQWSGESRWQLGFIEHGVREIRRHSVLVLDAASDLSQCRLGEVLQRCGLLCIWHALANLIAVGIVAW